ncbi:MAG: hypothetical protein LBB63_02720, partial [Holosporaceae bacterium]|nr:hypothetical protein [Holosporaceae bacterium]
MNKRGIEDKLKKLRQDLAELQESLDGTKGEPQVTDAGPQTVKEQGEISKTAKKHDVQRVRSRGGYPRGVYTVKSYGSYMEQASPRSCTTKSHEKGKQVYGNYEGSGSYRARNHTIKSYARGAGKSAYGNYESSGSYGARNHTVKSYARGAGKSSDG